MKKLLLTVLVATSLTFAGCGGDKYQDGVRAYNDGDYAQAIAIWKDVAQNQQNDQAMYAIYSLYKEKQNFISYDEAISWLMQAAQAGRPDAQYEYAMFLVEHGKYREAYENLESAAKWKNEDAKAYLAKWASAKLPRIKAEAGSFKGYYEYAEWLYNQNDPTFLDEAKNYASKVALKGDAKAQVLYGRINSKLNDYLTAFTWFDKAADQGDADGMYEVANLYEKGLGVVSNSFKAYNYYYKAANKGNSDAQLKVSLAYFDDKLPSTMKFSEEEAFRWIHSAAESGKAQAQFAMGSIYENGFGAKVDLKEAMTFYKQASDQGHKKAKRKLARLYVKVGSLEQKKLGFDYLNQILDENPNDYEVMTIVGDAYLNGWGATQNDNLGIASYRTAAEGGYPYAQYAMATFLSKGEHVDKNMKRAVYWLTQSAANGYPNAMLALCIMYENGIEFKKNNQKATQWCKQAKEKNMTDKAFIRKELGI